MTDISVTPIFITFEDNQGRLWKAMALIAPLQSEGMEPILIVDTEELKLDVCKIRVVGR